jgi:biopolymer transport protein ExbD
MGGGNVAKAEINVTPMIDVLLTLLVIFMIVAPTSPRGLPALVPQGAVADDTEARVEDIVITVGGDGRIELNQQAVAADELAARLRRIFETRGNAVVFVRGGADLEFRSVARVIDVARGAGLNRVALMTATVR